tara:strand:- start:2859 stop:3149 length:291 start_codon:yes stop_codon:yes gene_type:complete
LRTSSLEERVAFLEKEYNRIFHTEEMLYNEILRLMDIISTLNKAFWEKRSYTTSTMKVLNNDLGVYSKELLKHFESHYRDKKENNKGMYDTVTLEE